MKKSGCGSLRCYACFNYNQQIAHVTCVTADKYRLRFIPSGGGLPYKKGEDAWGFWYRLGCAEQNTYSYLQHGTF